MPSHLYKNNKNMGKLNEGNSRQVSWKKNEEMRLAQEEWW